MGCFGSPNSTLALRILRRLRSRRKTLAILIAGFLLSTACRAQQPSEPIDIGPIDGETYYFINQLSGLQMDLDNGSVASGATILIQNRSFTSLTQRWAITRLPGSVWAISNIANAGWGSYTYIPCAGQIVRRRLEFQLHVDRLPHVVREARGHCGRQ